MLVERYIVVHTPSVATGCVISRAKKFERVRYRLPRDRLPLINPPLGSHINVTRNASLCVI